MGRKVHPLGFRLGIIRDWQAKWYADKLYAEFLQEDFKIREAIRTGYAEAAVSQVQIERQAHEVFITIHTARPGIVIGRGGQRVDEMRAKLEQLIGKRVRLNIQEVAQPELDAYLVARTVADQIERRIAYRRAMKQALFRTTQAGAKGMKINLAGRLGGNEIARTENLHQGRVPLHTLRADIDYGFTEARTALGRIGVKVWIYKGDILPERKEAEAEEEVPVAAEVAEAPVEEEVPVAAEVAQAPVEEEAAIVAEVAEAPVEEEVAVAAEVAHAPAEEEVPVAAEVAQAPVEEEVPVAAEVAEAPVEEEAAIVAEVAETPVEPAPAAEPKKKPTRARASRKKTAPPAAESEESKPRAAAAKVRRAKASTTKEKATTEATTSISEEEEKDAATQTGEIPQDSSGTPPG